MSKLSIIAAALTLVSSTTLAEDGAVATASTTLALSSLSGAERSDDAEVFHRGRLVKHHGFYGAPTFGVTMLNDQAAPMIGMRSAWIANYNFGVGFTFNALANHVTEGAQYRGRALGGYGGLLLEYLIAPQRRVHGVIDTTIGGGVMCQQTGETGDDDCKGHAFVAIEPTANLELNVFKAMRVRVGAGYRAALGTSGSTLSNRELGGVVGRAALEFGKF
jgi:hypothetical protein